MCAAADILRDTSIGELRVLVRNIRNITELLVGSEDADYRSSMTSIVFPSGS